MGVADAGMGAMVQQLGAIMLDRRQTPCVKPAKPGHESLWAQRGCVYQGLLRQDWPTQESEHEALRT